MKYNFTVEIDKEADIIKLMYLWQNFSLLKYFLQQTHISAMLIYN